MILSSEIYVIPVNDPSEWVGGDMSGGYYSKYMHQQATESANRLLEGAEAAAAEYGTEVTTATTVGEPPSAIVQYAENASITSFSEATADAGWRGSRSGASPSGSPGVRRVL